MINLFKPFESKKRNEDEEEKKGAEEHELETPVTNKDRVRRILEDIYCLIHAKENAVGSIKEIESVDTSITESIQETIEQIELCRNKILNIDNQLLKKPNDKNLKR